MKFLDRTQEKMRLERALRSATGSLCCLYGRRRCGKSRLLQEVVRSDTTVFHVADQMEPSMQRARLATDMTAVVPGMDQVLYPDWGSLLTRWTDAAPSGACLVLDEFPYLAEQSSDVPSILQRLHEKMSARRVHLVLCGSSQRMMQGLVLDATAPLYGRAKEILKIKPLPFGWIAKAFPNETPASLLVRYSVWGGVPRYWELAADYGSHREAVKDLILSAQGVLHQEPRYLLLDDLSDVAQASTILALVGQGCQRMSEIAGRLGKPATSLTRPLMRLQELDMIVRETPFGADERNGKKSLYRLSDPFLAFWFRFVQPNQSALENAPLSVIETQLAATSSQHLAWVFETLARASVPFLDVAGQTWGEGRRWWGNGSDGTPMELDVIAESTGKKSLLVGVAKMSVTPAEVERIRRELYAKAQRLPFARHYQHIEATVFAAKTGKMKRESVYGISDLLRVLV
jgi:AAA+ ATPase superfamily predicted ATPase